MSYAYVIRTETESIFVNRIDIYHDYVFVKDGDTHILYRMLFSFDRGSVYPDAVLIYNGEDSVFMCEVSRRFTTAKEAFSCMEQYNCQLRDVLQERDACVSDESQNTSAIRYTYLFNYFGNDSVNDKVINGAFISVEIQPYCNGEHMVFNDEPFIVVPVKSGLVSEPIKQRIYLCDLVRIVFDRKMACNMSIHDALEHEFMRLHKWDNIRYQLVEQGFTYKDSSNVDSPLYVPGDVWCSFLIGHANAFDISDNRNAPCIGYELVE